ncbi:hypothetical protein ASE99_24215 [Serratia sp. Leaf51]|nr:hypothetical protein ASE99_24215 [Serratia sp. Leaf51]
MTSWALRNQHQGLHYLTDRVSANIKTLLTQLNTHAPTAIRRIHFSMNMPGRRMKLNRPWQGEEQTTKG